MMEDNKVNCPFCKTLVISEIEACEHLFIIGESGSFEWEGELEVLGQIGAIIYEYDDEKY